jgi:hypothetical protein
MIDDMLLQNWSTLHSPLIDLYRKAFRQSSRGNQGRVKRPAGPNASWLWKGLILQCA